MATLTIGDKTVTVDDSFLSLSPEQQNDTVEEIASSLGVSAPSQADPAPSQPDPGALRAGQLGIEQGATFGFSDELAAGLMTPIEAIKGAITGEDSGKGITQRLGDSYDRNLARERQELRAADANHPIAKTAGNVAGGLATGGALAKGGVTLLNVAKPTTANMVGRGAAEGAAYGAAYGLGEGEGLDDRLGKAARGAAVGGLIGGGLGVIGARGAQRAAERAVPDTEALKSASNAAYRQAEEAGIIFEPKSFAQGVDDIAATVAEAGIDKTLHPKATAALQRLMDAKGEPMTLKQFDTLRRVVNGAAKSIEPDERRVASIMVEKLDDYLSKLDPSEVIAGNPKVASAMIQHARKLWSQMRKSEMLDDMAEKVANNSSLFSGSGKENAMRNLFRNLANNKKLMRQFSKEEQDAIKKIARGGLLENAARMIGKAAPTGIVSGGIGSGAGFMMGGPLGAVAVPAIGAAGRGAATALTGRNLRAAETLIRNGGIRPSAEQLTETQRVLIDALLKGGATQAPEIPSFGLTGSRDPVYMSP